MHSNGSLRSQTPAFRTRPRSVQRRGILPKTGYHLYFALEREETVLVIHSLWGARRGRGPKL